MACYHPIPAYQETDGHPVRLWPPLGTANLALPCARCIGCRTDRATQWANRCMHEAAQWPANSFINLTYDDAHIPRDGEVSPRALTLFIKRLRTHTTRYAEKHDRDHRSTLRYFACGEYGGLHGRPHYHLLTFNEQFRDLQRVGTDLYSSETLRELWPYGDHKIGTVTHRSAAYIAQYSLSKLTREVIAGDEVDSTTGECRKAPFLRMSRRPAVGSAWVNDYASDLEHGYLVSPDGRKHAIPRHYREHIKHRLPELHARVLQVLERNRINNRGDKQDPARLRDAETTHFARKRQQLGYR